MSEIATFNAHPTVAVRAESPLAFSRVTVATLASAQGAGVCIRERALLGHLILRGKADDAGFRAGVESALGVSLPLKMGPVSRDDGRGVSVQWMSPDEWLVVVPQGEDHATEQRLRQALTGHYAVMQVSGAQTMLELSGPNALDVLKKSAGYDFHPRNFPVGKGISTTLMFNGNSQSGGELTKSYGFYGQLTFTPANSKATFAGSFGASCLADDGNNFKTENSLVSGGIYYQATKSLKLVGEGDYMWSKDKEGSGKNKAFTGAFGLMLFY